LRGVVRITWLRGSVVTGAEAGGIFLSNEEI
jgi:hypothetical protein